MSEVIAEMMGVELAELMGIYPVAPEEEQIFVASVPDKVHGAGVLAYQDFMDKAAEKKAEVKAAKNAPIKGKQTVKQLIGQGQGVSTMDIGDTGVRDFKKIANEYGVDFAITKDKTVDGFYYILVVG